MLPALAPAYIRAAPIDLRGRDSGDLFHVFGGELFATVAF
jgi:hypothetical protein